MTIYKMKTKFFYPLMVLSIHILMSNGGGGGYVEPEYVSFPMINSEIRNSLGEHETQKELKKEQTANVSLETTNKTFWTKYKETTKKVQDRLRIIDFAMQSIPTGYAIYLEGQAIRNTQKRIIEELRDSPSALVIALPDQIKFVDDLQMTTRLLVGIVASYGAINQMEKADRKKLLDYALEEVKLIKYKANFLLYKILEFKENLQNKKHLLKYYVQRDKALVDDIIKNIKKL